MRLILGTRISVLSPVAAEDEGQGTSRSQLLYASALSSRHSLIDVLEVDRRDKHTLNQPARALRRLSGFLSFARLS